MPSVTATVGYILGPGAGLETSRLVWALAGVVACRPFGRPLNRCLLPHPSRSVPPSQGKSEKIKEPGPGSAYPRLDPTLLRLLNSKMWAGRKTYGHSVATLGICKWSDQGPRCDRAVSGGVWAPRQNPAYAVIAPIAGDATTWAIVYYFDAQYVIFMKKVKIERISSPARL